MWLSVHEKILGNEYIGNLTCEYSTVPFQPQGMTKSKFKLFIKEVLQFHNQYENISVVLHPQDITNSQTQTWFKLAVSLAKKINNFAAPYVYNEHP